MYYVTRWDNKEVISEWAKLATAKRYARGEGHTGELLNNNRYPPVAYVANERGQCVYNPIFRHSVGQQAGAIIDRYDANFDSRTA